MTASSWSPSPAHARAIAVTLVFTAVAILDRRPDLLVLAAPLAVVVLWTEWRRPAVAPEVGTALDHPAIREGQTTTWRTRVTARDGRAEDVAVVFRSPGWVEQRPESGVALADLAAHGASEVSVTVRPIRWGAHRLAPPLVVTAGPWNGYRTVWNVSEAAREVLAMPQATGFDAVASHAPARGLVGVNRAARPGAGTEFADIRPFQPGDRLKRIHWAHTLRTGEMHVTSTWADTDRHIVLLIDAFEDVGEPDGVDGRASSLDVTVRAAAAIAEHFTRVGDRISLVTTEARRVRRLPAGSGQRHLRRVLRALAEVRPSPKVTDRGTVPRGLGGSALIVMLSPLLSTGSLDRLARVASQGSDLVVVDCLPTDLATADGPDVVSRLAWRLEGLERERRLDAARVSGVPIVDWRGSGSLDQVLVALGRRRRSGAAGR